MVSKWRRSTPTLWPISRRKRKPNHTWEKETQKNSKGEAFEEENGNKELEIIYKEPKRSTEIEAAQLRAAQFFKTLENIVSAGDKPSAVIL